MEGKPQDAPEDCPGLESKEAGFHDTCQGCPNKKIC